MLFNGNSCSPMCAIYSTSNVSSVQRTSAGVYTIYFSAPLPNDKYTFSGSALSANNVPVISEYASLLSGYSLRGVSNFTIWLNNGVGGAMDADYIGVNIFQ